MNLKHSLLLLCILADVCMAANHAKVSDYSFLRINSESGLSQSNVKTIIQDSYGFMWFGTKNGLNRYDGERIVNVDCYDPEKNRRNHNVSALFEDRNGRLWVGTDEGVYVYDIRHETFHFLDNHAPDGEMMCNWVATIKEDHNGNIWIVVPHKGIFRWSHDALFHYSLSEYGAVSDLCVLDDGSIWTSGWYMGLLRYDEASDKFVQVSCDRQGNSLLDIETNTISPDGYYLVMAVQNGKLKRYDTRQNLITDISVPGLSNTYVRTAEAFGDEIWVGTHNGLYVVNTTTGDVVHARSSFADSNSLSDNIIYDIYRDHDGGTWLGTMFGGVNYYAERNFNFQKFLPRSNDKNSLSSPRIRGMVAVGSRIYVGTEDAGVNVVDVESQQVERLPIPQTVDEPTVLVVDAYAGNVYCSYFKNGLQVFDSRGNDTFYPCSQLNIDGSIYAMTFGHDGRMWIGVDRGLFYSESTSPFHFRKIDAFQKSWVVDILETNTDEMWVATIGSGVAKYNMATSEVKFYVNDPGNPKTISSNSVSSVMKDQNGNLWFSTDRGGICRYNRETDDFTCYSIAQGLPDDVAYDILEDDNGFLWFGTNRGLVKFNLRDESVRVYTTRDGLSNNQFNYQSAVKGSDGRFYFGSIGGLVAFDPDTDIKENSYSAPIYFTRLIIGNEEVTVHMPDSPLEESIIVTDEIKLPYNENSFSLDVALLSYSTTQTNEYYYRLEPVDKHWIRSSQTSIQFANLLPGEYVLHVSALPGGPGAEIRSLKIVVLPPWWKSPIAIIVWAVLLACLFAAWFTWYRRHKNAQLAERQKLFEVEKEKELFESKVEFFTEVAHEIRTPLTLINGPLEVIKENGNVGDPKLAKNLQVIEQNTRRLLDLASQLLDFQKIGANKLKLKYSEVDVSQLLLDTVARFETTYMHDNKTLRIKHCDEHLVAYIDKEAITKILSNLLTNGLKYGTSLIEVELRRDGDNLVVKVSSDGNKIPEERKEQIFEPFYQLDNRTRERRGVGIGLSLSRSLAKAHKGSLILDPTAGDNINVFILTIPLNRADGNSTDEEIPVEAPEVPLIRPLDEEDNNLLAEQDTGEPESEELVSGGRILVVDDEPDLLNFICDRLAETFDVLRAGNGEEALELLRQNTVDLVLSDVMMPVMDGIEMCKVIKSDLSLCHIPVIFLTAKNDINSKIEGLKAGAEAYIEKPFSFDYLKSQIVSLLSNRRKEREAFSKRPFFPMQGMQMSKADELFMERAVKVINDHITEEQFNVERLAEELCMSRSSLLRKIKSVFNLPPLDFIRLIKMKKAAELIKEGNCKMGEVSFMVGFSSHSYFSKLFSKQFGMTPKEFEKQVQQKRDQTRFKGDEDESV